MIDLIGKRYGRLIVVSESQRHYSKGGHVARMWNCVCDCGNKKVLSTGNLNSGNTKSCGCLRSEMIIKKYTTHGKCHTRLYKIYSLMKDRCYNKSTKAYRYYGKKGVSICAEWLNDFISFYEWALKNGYRENLTIERINVNGDYEPDNCTWITQSEQVRNRTNTHFIKYDGEIMTLSEASQKFNTSRSTLRKYEKIFNGDSQKAIEHISKHCIRKIEEDSK